MNMIAVCSSRLNICKMQSVISIYLLLLSHHISTFPTSINLIYCPLSCSLDIFKFIISAYRAFNYFHLLYHRLFIKGNRTRTCNMRAKISCLTFWRYPYAHFPFLRFFNFCDFFRLPKCNLLYLRYIREMFCSHDSALRYISQVHMKSRSEIALSVCHLKMIGEVHLSHHEML